MESRGQNELRYAIALILVLLGGCTTIYPDPVAENGGRSVWMLGFVRVIFPDQQGKLVAVDVRTLGAGWDRGPYLGWKSGNWIVADPARCQLLVVIRSAAQADNAIRIIQSLGGQKPCIVDETHQLHR